MVLSHSRFLAELLGVTRDKGRAFYLFHVYVAFLLSGLLHAVPAWVVSRTDGAAMAYFMLQAVGITFEVCFWRPVGKWLGLGEGMSPGVREPIANGIAKNPEDERRKSRKRALVKTMGFMWTVVWFSITNTVLIEGIVAVGMHPLPDFQGAPWWVRYVCTYWGRVI